MSENLLLKECLDAFFKNLADDSSFPKSLLQTLIDLRSTDKLAKGDNLRDAMHNYQPGSGDEA